MKTPLLLTKYRTWLFSSRGLNMIHVLSTTTIHFTQRGMVGWAIMCNGPRLILGLKVTICNCDCKFCDFWMSLESETTQNEIESIMTMRTGIVGGLEWAPRFVIDLNSGHLNEHPCMKLGLKITVEWASRLEIRTLATWMNIQSRELGSFGHLNEHPS